LYCSVDPASPSQEQGPVARSSEFYQARRSAIKDLAAYLGFVIGFIGAAPLGWPFLTAGFAEDGDAAAGLLRFIATVLGGGVAGAVLLFVIGMGAGWVWERAHRGLRTPVAPDDTPPPQRTVLSEPPMVGDRPRDWSRPAGPADRFRYGLGMRSGEFLNLVHRVHPDSHDARRATAALARTINIGAWDGERLVGSVRVLTDGYFHATIPELIVDPEYRGQGIGRALLERALDVAPGGRIVVTGPAEAEGFFQRIGAERGETGFTLRARPAGADAPAP
jgi:GNAT superfamily N-acetyltransferase